MIDLITRNTNLPDGGVGVDIAVDKGRILENESQIETKANQTLNLDHWLVSTPFIDPHFHIDSTLSAGRPASTKAVLYWKALKSGEIWYRF